MTTPATVFIVDDDASVRTGLSRLLRASGFDVEAYASGEAFVAREVFDGTGCVYCLSCAAKLNLPPSESASTSEGRTLMPL